MATMPIWIVVLQALLTPTIAAVAGLVAFLQWRTAHQKVVLDLFERRLQAYHKIIDAVEFSLTVEGSNSTMSISNSISRSWRTSRFLFGNEISEAIADIEQDIHNYGFALRQRDNPNSSVDVRISAEKSAQKLHMKLLQFHRPFTLLCLPYIHMNQKLVRTPVEWLHDKNLQRLSYADEKQR